MENHEKFGIAVVSSVIGFSVMALIIGYDGLDGDFSEKLEDKAFAAAVGTAVGLGTHEALRYMFGGKRERTFLDDLQPIEGVAPRN